MSMNSATAGSGSIKLHTNDFYKFSHIAFKLSVKSGFLLKQGTINSYSLKKRFFVLYSSLLYYFENDEPHSCIGLVFTESCTISIPKYISEDVSYRSIEHQLSQKDDGIIFKDFPGEVSYPFTVTTIGGKKCTLFAPSSEDRELWIDYIISEQRKSFRRALEQLKNPDGSQTDVHMKALGNENHAYFPRAELAREIDRLSRDNHRQEERIACLEEELRSKASSLEACEAERDALLAAKGIVPKLLPSNTSVTQSSLDTTFLKSRITDSNSSCGADSKDLRVWAGTWNMGAQTVSQHMTTASNQYGSFILEGYDIYALGVQECIGNDAFRQIQELLSANNIWQVDLQQSLESDGGTVFYSHRSQSTDVAPNLQNSSASQRLSDSDKVCGRGDGSLIATKYTGIAIYLTEKLQSAVQVLAISKFSFSAVTSKGGVAVALSIAGRTVVFVSCHLEPHHENVQLRREQYQNLLSNLGSGLAEEGFNLNVQFHHVIWVGDMNYRLCKSNSKDDSYLHMSSNEALEMLQSQQPRKLFNDHDQLNLEKRKHQVFYGYREADPFPNFYPTYKKIENHGPIDFSNPLWAEKVYRLKYKEPFYKGGAVKERTPGFCDRVFYFSTPDLSSSLRPEKVAAKLDLMLNSSEQSIDSLVKYLDNYQSVLEGVPFTISDHAPVFGTFNLHIEKYVERVNQQNRFKDWLQAEGSHSRSLGSKVSETVGEPDSTDSDMELNLDLEIGSALRRCLSSESSHRPKTLITLSNMSLIWGSTEDFPCGVRMLFPQPFEVAYGEYFSALENASTRNDSTANSVDLFQNFPKKVKSHRPGWSSMPSDTHTCASLKYCQSYSTGGVVALQDHDLSNPIEDVTVSWTHPTVSYENLHIVLKVAVPAAEISSPVPHNRLTLSTEKRIEECSSQFPREQVDTNDYMIGQCCIGLNRLWLTAKAQSDENNHKKISSHSASISVAQILIKDGSPMYNVDKISMQREVVTLCCNVSLSQSDF